MKRKLLLLLIFFVIMSGCSSDYPTRTGTYKSVPFGTIKMEIKHLFSGLKGYYCGSRLTIYADSSFIYKRTPYISKGRWYRDRDSLVLVFNECLYINDRIRLLYQKYHIPDYTGEARKYLVRKDYLIRYGPLKGKRDFVEKLDLMGP
jgi:hypothetical protein